jgi:hypothetical protein
MEEKKETITEASIEYLLDSILRSKPGDGCNTSLTGAPIEISASPEEGVRLIRAFTRIKQPELRAAIINLATQMADVGALPMPAQN